MKSIKKIIGPNLILLISFTVISCSSSSNFNWKQNKDYYKIYLPDYDYFVKYEILSLNDYYNNIYYVLVEKKNQNEIPPFTNYKVILKAKYYRLSLKKIDSVVTIKSRDFVNSIYIDKVLIWQNDTIKVPVYISENIYGRYIEIIK